MIIGNVNIKDLVHPLLRDKPVDELESIVNKYRTASVSYYYKPQTKYPPRVYVMLGFWLPRNLRPMGLYHASPLYTRLVTEGEIINMISSLRQKYYQYESWKELIQAEIATEAPEQYIIAMLQAFEGKSLNDGKGSLDLYEKYRDAEIDGAYQLQMEIK